MPGRTTGVDTQTTPPVDVVQPEQANESGRLGPRNVTGTPGRSLIGGRGSEVSSPAPESIHTRTATRAREDLPELMKSKLEDSMDDEQASQILDSLQASRKSSRTSPHELSGLYESSTASDPHSDESAQLHEEPGQISPGEHGDSPAPDANDESISPTATSPSEQPHVSVSSSDDPDVQSRKEAFKNQLQPKLGFFDKHKKESTVTAVGGVLVGIGAIASIAFPPAGLCIYACGIMMLSMGLTEIMAAPGDAPVNPPDPKPDKPEPKPDESKSKPVENNVDDGKFMAVRKPILEALTQGDGPIPVREDGSLDEDEAKKRLRKFAQESGINGDPEALLEQVSSGMQAGLPLSEVISEAIADVLSRDKSFDPRDNEFKLVTNAILSAAEAMMNATSATEREQALADFLSKMKEMLPRMSDASLGQLMAMTQGALASPGTEQAREILTHVLKLLEAEKAERLLKQQSLDAFGAAAGVSGAVPEPPPPPPIAPKSGKPLTTPPQSSARRTGASEVFDPTISQNRVHLRVLSFELGTLQRADRLGESDRIDFLNAAKEVLEKPRGRRITGAEFLDELERHTGDRFSNVIEKMRDKNHFK
ncbi:hypothetical protein [Endozoicomonas sp. 8E]|uniref:hypothetical protein n=1 Tax=Endozoicomonas sp. 8E TaxID=3035692 RepID=UPI0029390A21|nr:hypothetical protein [Endozoicomonas sp. 8E]WOG29308.1 hypothetical protein P6910_06555 [Endozoicomonas sp. 8E]